MTEHDTERDAEHDTASALRASYAAQRDAMVAGDAEALGEELGPDFTLTHMTGYEQTRREWLQQVDSGAMTYHSMTDVAVEVEVEAEVEAEDEDEEPVLRVRTRTDATIWGSRGTWPLQLEIHFHRLGDRWVAGSTIASTW